MAADSYDDVLDRLAATVRAEVAHLRAGLPEGMDRTELHVRWTERPGQDDRWVHAAVSSILIALDPPDPAPPVAAGPQGALYRLELLCEVRSDAEVDRLVEAMRTAACPHDAHEDHECPVPWMTIASRIEDEDPEAPGIREMLNR